ncbi:uncharacterized protein BDV17DRAFT_199019 [Aspergillus undulatus]|uniref:uncharacterized protein n=1 Tax=Aspergillus undulatus TaxID=1810928 RepID=UPI003CCCBBB5
MSHTYITPLKQQIWTPRICWKRVGIFPAWYSRLQVRILAAGTRKWEAIPQRPFPACLKPRKDICCVAKEDCPWLYACLPHQRMITLTSVKEYPGSFSAALAPSVRGSTSCPLGSTMQYPADSRQWLWHLNPMGVLAYSPCRNSTAGLAECGSSATRISSRNVHGVPGDRRDLPPMRSVVLWKNRDIDC